ncbi:MULTISPECIES: BRCT domain-containing protein [Photobacterium]|uniref:BRCT domain-containing protein n=1 Tax=Photobacterium TaxID=657 RepID=UPI001E50291D|nr:MULTISPECIES: helix-hairpin-helix domain-containing protein [Photobacterium]MCD9476307.1 hypothetical protein [Photobacterium phosphoreum]MCD9508083.1 hypothetical protein [Photobacterium phosphoreum]MCD9539178.1 hypothetical protein [Photobacterium carnosum]MCD9542342.1 hypothetical protein [Photobacterium carnosum]MCD9546087.1 hypothetical protein [Photobacterium carnosum]
MKELLAKPVMFISNDELSALCIYLNDEYRKGCPLVSDNEFDDIYLAELKFRQPNHPLLTHPQPENFGVESTQVDVSDRIKHAIPMLSTNKAYSVDEVSNFVARCEAAAIEAGVEPSSLTYRLSAKLDGIAGKLLNSGTLLVTRGDGVVGNNISHLLENGLVIMGDGSKDSVGEIVMEQAYFDANLADKFAHPRNVVAGIAASRNINEFALKALKDGAVRLVIYRDMPVKTVDKETLIQHIDLFSEKFKEYTQYPTDGLVIEITDEATKAVLGSTSHHNNWMLAKKNHGETAIVEVKEVRYQVGRTGRLTPVVEFASVFLSGCSIERATGHHVRNILANKIAIGAKIEIVRSGEVVPSCLRVVSVSDNEPVDPISCPYCGHKVEWVESNSGELPLFKECQNPNCSAQAVTTIMYHFKTLKADLFGEKTVEKLVDGGHVKIEDIYHLTIDEIQKCGLGAGQAANLISEIERIKSSEIADNLILASLGIHKLGRGQASKMLEHHTIADIASNGITAKELIKIAGFGKLISISISDSINEQLLRLNFLIGQFSKIVDTKSSVPIDTNGVLSGLNVVFTGAMESGSRDEMKARAKQLGANVQSSVNGKTNYLICGNKVGAKKIQEAEAKGAKMISEHEYLIMINK